MSNLQKFVIEKIQRNQINKARYNPRKINESNKKRLLESIQRVGLVSPITVNKRTMNIVGGHQRIDILDSIEGDNYVLDVAMIDVDPIKEKEINILLNNPSIMGEFDLDLLTEMSFDLDFTKLGFSDIEITLFSDQSKNDLFGVNEVDTEQKPYGETKLNTEEAEEIRKRHLETKVAVSNYFTLIFDSDVDKLHFCEKLGLTGDKNSIRYERFLEVWTN